MPISPENPAKAEQLLEKIPHFSPEEVSFLTECFQVDIPNRPTLSTARARLRIFLPKVMVILPTTSTPLKTQKIDLDFHLNLDPSFILNGLLFRMIMIML